MMEKQNATIPHGIQVECWDHKFRWTQDHLSNEKCEELRQAYDVLGDECFKKLKIIQSQQDHSAGHTSSRDLYSLFRDNQASDPHLRQLWTELNTVPSWVDWDQISRGQDVLYRYWGPMFIGLYSTLLEGVASPQVAETFAKNGGFAGAMAAKRRLYETAQFVLEITKSAENLMPGGELERRRKQMSKEGVCGNSPTRLDPLDPHAEQSCRDKNDSNTDAGVGFRSCVRIRFLHAAVRQRLLSKAAPLKPGEISQNPIPHLHELGTISFFGPKLILLSLPRQYITFLSDQEKADWIALWRLVGSYLGTPTDPYFTSVYNSKVTMESLLVHGIRPSKASRKVARNVIDGLLSDESALTANSEGILVEGARICLGRHLTTELGIGEYGDGKLSPVTSRLLSLFFRALVISQCLLFAAVCYLNRSSRSWDRRAINAAKSWFWVIVVESKFGLNGAKWEYSDRWEKEKGTEKLSAEEKLATKRVEKEVLTSSCCSF